MIKKVENLSRYSSILVIIIILLGCKTNKATIKNEIKPCCFLNDLNLADSINVDQFISIFGKPDSTINDKNFEEEFGYPTTYLYYSKNMFEIRQNYIHSMAIYNAKYYVNTLKVGDNVEKVRNTISIFKEEIHAQDSLITTIDSLNDLYISYYYANNIITRIELNVPF